MVAIHIRGFEQTLYARFGKYGLELHAYSDSEPDTIFDTTIDAMLRTLFPGARKEELFFGPTEVRGDIELGQRVMAILQRVEIDGEELASGLIGDVAAHQLNRARRALTEWALRGGESLRQDLGEYLREETQVLPNQWEVASLLDEVDDLRANVDRLEARILRLEGRLLAPQQPRPNAQGD
jgi:ubiquinone biosynthesis protein UbiJ